MVAPENVLEILQYAHSCVAWTKLKEACLDFMADASKLMKKLGLLQQLEKTNNVLFAEYKARKKLLKKRKGQIEKEQKVMWKSWPKNVGLLPKIPSSYTPPPSRMSKRGSAVWKQSNSSSLRPKQEE